MKNISSQNPHNSMTEDKFVDLYDFLGIQPVSPPNLIYLAIQKLERFLERESSLDNKEVMDDFYQKLQIARDELLNTSSRRESYEKFWESYYFPKAGELTNVEKLCQRNYQSKLLGLKFRTKTSLTGESQEDNYNETFDYCNDFTYFVMRDLPKERDVFYLDPSQDIYLSPLQDTIFFDEARFYLQSHGKVSIELMNDALGKNVVVQEKFSKLPLHIGDRIEFDNGARLILRSIYSKEKSEENSNNTSFTDQLGFYCQRENVIIGLDTNKNYIFGRNTSDIHHLPFEEDTFCFVNIGRRERSISRQNFQVFHHKGSWYIQDLGSRYGTTLDFFDHYKFETLAGGSIMPLEKGLIRLGYDKSYGVEIGYVSELEKKKNRRQEQSTGYSTSISFYDVPLL